MVSGGGHISAARAVMGQIEYVATHPEGNTLALLLPQPNKAKVYREDLAPLPP